MTEWLIHTHKRWENWGLERNGFVPSPKVNTCLFKFYNLGFWQGPIFSVNIFLVQKPNFYAHWVCLWQDTHALWCWSNGLLRVCSCAAHIYTTALKTHGVCACHSVLTSLKALSTDYTVSATLTWQEAVHGKRGQVHVYEHAVMRFVCIRQRHRLMPNKAAVHVT